MTVRKKPLARCIDKENISNHPSVLSATGQLCVTHSHPPFTPGDQGRVHSSDPLPRVHIQIIISSCN